MTDNGDQAALNALVNDCYGGQWPTTINDLMIDPRDGESIYLMSNEFDIAWIKRYHHYKRPIRPLASTWVEGRLMKLIGEAFSFLHIAPNGNCTCGLKGKRGGTGNIVADADTYHAHTPITALVVALRAVLKQGEGEQS